MKTEDVLQNCIAQVLAGKQTPAECAARYPQFLDLEADLKAATVLRSAQALALSPDAERRIETKLRQSVGKLAPVGSVSQWLARPPVRLRWMFGSAAALSLLLAGFGTVGAASASNPGDLLYGVKRADESVQVFLSPPSTRAVVYAGLARRRLDEITIVVQRARPDAATVTGLSDDLMQQTSEALAFVDAAPVGQQAEILTTLLQLTDEQQAVLTALQPAAPTEAQAGLERAIEASNQEHILAAQRLEQVLASPSETSSPTATVTGTATATPSRTTTATPSATATEEPGARKTHVPPGQTKVPPGQTKVPPGQTKVPPGLTHMPAGQTQGPPGQTQVPAGQTQVPAGQTKVPPGQDRTPEPTKLPGGHGL